MRVNILSSAIRIYYSGPNFQSLAGTFENIPEGTDHINIVEIIEYLDTDGVTKYYPVILHDLYVGTIIDVATFRPQNPDLQIKLSNFKLSQEEKAVLYQNKLLPVNDKTSVFSSFDEMANELSKIAISLKSEIPSIYPRT